MKKEFKVVFIILILFLALFLINNFKQDKIDGNSVFDVFKNTFTKAVGIKNEDHKPNPDEQYYYTTQWGSQILRGSRYLDGTFGTAGDLAVNKNKDIYVSDSFRNDIQIFDSRGIFKNKFGSYGSGDGQFYALDSIEIDYNGNIYVADKYNFRVQKFGSNGNFITKWGSQGFEEGQFEEMSGIATDSQGNVYVADSALERVQKFDSSGNFITKWGSFGGRDGQFRSPDGIDVDINDNVYVVDKLNFRIQKFDSSGNFITKWGSQGFEEGQFNLPVDINSDSNGKIYVVDKDNYRIQKFDSNGNFITKWGSDGYFNGQFHYPRGVVVDVDGFVYVTDSLGTYNGFNNRVQKFSLTPPNGDISGPEVLIKHSPEVPRRYDPVTYTATASDDSEVLEIRIVVDGETVKICSDPIRVSTCSYKGYANFLGSYYYYSLSRDRSENYNTGRDPKDGTKIFYVND